MKRRYVYSYSEMDSSVLHRSTAWRREATGAQISLLRGPASVPHPLPWRNEAPPYLLSGELCTSPFHSNRLFVYTVCCRRRDQCFSVLRTRHTDVMGDSSGRSYVTEQWHNVPLLRTREIGSIVILFVYIDQLSISLTVQSGSLMVSWEGRREEKLRLGIKRRNVKRMPSLVYRSRLCGN